MRGRKPKPTALKVVTGNPGRRPLNPHEPEAPTGLPECPGHLSNAAREEWERIAETLHRMGLLSEIDRAALAAYCAAWGRWVEAEENLARTPALIKTPSGHVRQSPWIGIANRQLEIMAKFMAELGLTPSARSRVTAGAPAVPPPASNTASKYFT